MTETLVTRTDIEKRITELRDKQRRMPDHWVDRREEVAADLEALVLEWLAADQ